MTEALGGGVWGRGKRGGSVDWVPAAPGKAHKWEMATQNVLSYVYPRGPNSKSWGEKGDLEESWGSWGTERRFPEADLCIWLLTKQSDHPHLIPRTCLQHQQQTGDRSHTKHQSLSRAHTWEAEQISPDNHKLVVSLQCANATHPCLYTYLSSICAHLPTTNKP